VGAFQEKESVSLDDMDTVHDYFPKPMQALIKFFESEFKLGLKKLISDAGLVSKKEYMVQKKMLIKAKKHLLSVEERVLVLEKGSKEAPDD